MTIRELYEAIGDIISPEYDELSTIIWDICIKTLYAKDAELGSEVEYALAKLFECERSHAFEVGYKTAVSLILAGVTAK